jgi:hypothetical protein
MLAENIYPSRVEVQHAHGKIGAGDDDVCLIGVGLHALWDGVKVEQLEIKIIKLDLL